MYVFFIPFVSCSSLTHSALSLWVWTFPLTLYLYKWLVYLITASPALHREIDFSYWPMNALKSLDGEDLWWGTVSFGCSDPLTVKVLLQRRSEPWLGSLSLVRLSAEMLVCREWLRQWEEERKKGGCRVMRATVSPQAVWSGGVHPTSLSSLLTPPTSPPLSSGTGAGEGHTAKHNGATDSGSVLGSLADTSDTGEASWWWWLVCNTTGNTWFWFFDLMSNHEVHCSLFRCIRQWRFHVRLRYQRLYFFVFAVVGRCQSHCFILPRWHTDAHTHMHTCIYLTLLLRDSQGVLLILVNVCVHVCVSSTHLLNREAAQRKERAAD